MHESFYQDQIRLYSQFSLLNSKMQLIQIAIIEKTKEVSFKNFEES